MSHRSSGAVLRPLLAVAAILGSLAAGAPALADDNPLVGAWRRSDGVTLTLDADGRFTRSAAAGHARVEGTYQLEEGALVLLSDDGDLVGGYGVELDERAGRLTLLREGDEEGTIVEERYVRASGKAPVAAPAMPAPTAPAAAPSAPAAKPPPPAAPAATDALSGRWVEQSEEGSQDVHIFLPGGRAVWGSEPDGLTFGTYSLRGQQLELVDVAGNGETRQIQLTGTRLRYDVQSSSGWSLPKIFGRSTTPLAELARLYGAPAPGALLAALTGRWKERSDYTESQLVVTADRRVYEIEDEDAPPTRIRLRAADAKTLTLQPRHAPPYAVPYAIYGPTRLLLVRETSNAMKLVAEYRKQPDSGAAVRGWADAVEAAIERENAHWRKKFPVGPIASTARMLAVGNVPTDPNPTRVLPDGRVFQSIQAYFWMGTAWVVKVGPRAGATVYDRTDWYLLPSGRLYLRVASEGGATPLVNGVWGRYTIDEKDRIRFEPDEGKPELLELDDGRRRLYQGYKGFKNLLWASGKIK